MSLFRAEYKERQGLTEKVKVEKLTTNVKKGIEWFANRLDPEVAREIKDWADDPELSKLLKKLQSLMDWQQFLNHYAEAMVARYLIKSKCQLEVEVATVEGRSADFKVTKDNNTFFIHIKRLNDNQETKRAQNIPKRLRDLEKIPKPIIFCVQLFRVLTNGEMEELYKQAKNFVNSAKVGETIVFKDEKGKSLAKGRIDSIHNGGHVRLLYTVVAHDHPRNRLYEKLSDAHKQFMPEELNIILVASNDSGDVEDFEASLSDSLGFWVPNKHSDSHIVGWFNFGTKVDSINFKMRYRENYQAPETIKILFEKKTL